MNEFFVNPQFINLTAKRAPNLRRLLINFDSRSLPQSP